MQHVTGNLSNHHLPGGGRDPEVVEHRCGNCYSGDLGKSALPCKNDPEVKGNMKWEALVRRAKMAAAEKNGRSDR